MAQKKLKIHSENILPIIKKWLYSDKDIFLRELVSNACDAIQKVKVLQEKGEYSPGDDPFQIAVTIDKDARTVTISDNGIGMTMEEVEQYIAQLAFSGAEDFLAKYKTENEGDQIIGHFGLGFYSAYMVAERVELQTRSFQGDGPVRWECDGSSDYVIDEGSREGRGTDVCLHIAKEEEEYLDEERLKQILKQYCSFLPVPILLNEQRINEEEPLWLKNPSSLRPEEYLAFYRTLYPMEEDPLFWVHLSVDYPFHLRGVLYFPKLRRDFDFSKSAIKLFCNRVFVSEDCKDLVPDHLMMLRGALDSPDVPLNVSRSTLQMDRNVRQLAAHVSKKVADRLVALLRTDRERFISCWRDLEVILKLGAMRDDKLYERVKECLIWKNLAGEWTTVEEYLERNQEKLGRKVFYTTDERHQTHCLNLYRDQGIEVLYTVSALDSHFVGFLESKLQGVQFQRIDGAVPDVILDKQREKGLLDQDGKSESARIAEFIDQALGIEGVQVQAKSLASESLPAFVVLDEQMRRMRDYLASADPDGKAGPDLLQGKCTFVVNTNSPLIAAIQQLHGKDQTLASDLLRQLYEQALLSQREMKPEALDAFVERNNRVLQALVALKS